MRWYQKIKVEFRLAMLVGVLILLLVLIGGQLTKKAREQERIVNRVKSEFKIPKVKESIDKSFKECKDVYNKDTQDLKYLYITVFDEDLDRGYSNFSDVNAFVARYGVYEGKKPKARVIFQEGDKDGPAPRYFGYNANRPNGSICVRGKSSSHDARKSYKITLKDSGNGWNGHKKVNLNKHPSDITRVRNKLSFDLFIDMECIGSLRSQFVQVFIKDLSKNKNAKFVNYGLFTQIEQVNKRYLRTHGLDPSGNLYKASNFEFLRYPGEIEEVNNPNYDFVAFETRLETKGSKNHAPLIEMLDNVNDESRDIDEVIDKYFDRENYLTWLSINILTGNRDITSQNFYLYKPTNFNTWYFIPWDYDGAWGFYDRERALEEYGLWRMGIQNFWPVRLHQRFLLKEKNRDDLLKKMDEVISYLSEEKIKDQLEMYFSIVSEKVTESPDVYTLGATIEKFVQSIEDMPKWPQIYKKEFLDSLERPTPVFLGEPKIESQKVLFEWERSYDFQEDKIYYDFFLSKSLDFKNMVFQKKGLEDPEIEIQLLPKGMYFYKVKIRDDKGNEMVPFDAYRDLEGEKHFGVRMFEVK